MQPNGNGIPAFLNRSVPLLTDEGIARLSQCRIAVAGCGGVGAAVAITLARTGLGHFNLSDPGVFDEPDINRQWGATTKTIGKRKVEVYAQLLKEINPNIEVKTFPEGVRRGRQDTFLEGVDLLVDCLDVEVPLEVREELFEKARARRIFSMTAPILGFGCVLGCSSPEGMSMNEFTRVMRYSGDGTKFPDFLKRIFMPEHLERIETRPERGKVPSLAVAPLIASSLAVTESLAYLLDGVIPGTRQPVVLPKVILFDLFRMSYMIVDGRMILQAIGEDSDD